MENLLLVDGYLIVAAAAITIVEMVSRLIGYWKWLNKTDDGKFYDETWDD